MVNVAYSTFVHGTKSTSILAPGELADAERVHWVRCGGMFVQSSDEAHTHLVRVVGRQVISEPRVASADRPSGVVKAYNRILKNLWFDVYTVKLRMMVCLAAGLRLL